MSLSKSADVAKKKGLIVTITVAKTIAVAMIVIEAEAVTGAVAEVKVYNLSIK